MTQKIIYESAETETRRNIKLGYIVGIFFIIIGVLTLTQELIFGRFIVATGLFFMFCSFITKLIQKL